MRRFEIKKHIVMMGALWAAHATFAIALEDLATGEIAPTNAGYSLNWDYAYTYNDASCVAVDRYWVLTAGHVAAASATINVNGEIHTQQERVYHAQATDPDGNPTADLALIRFDKPFPGYYPLHDAVPNGGEMIVVGFGRPGDVARNRFGGYFTEDSEGALIKRWGTNRIEAPVERNGIKGMDFMISGTRGNQSGTPHEAGCNDKDSGCGVFHNDGGTWKLAGTLIYRLGTAPEFAGNFAAGTAHYANWIKTVIVDYDEDMNDLPDWWEDAYGVSDPAADEDADGFSNLGEWIADTNPTNAASFLAIGAFTNGTDLVFASSSNRVYRIETSDQLTDQQWIAKTDWFDGDHPFTTTILSAGATNEFLRLRARRY